MKKLRIVLADDHAILRSGLKLLVESDSALEVVGEAADGLEALKLVESLRPDITILDISLPRMDGITCLKEIRNRGLATKVVILTMHEDENYIKEAMQAGADAYVQKSAVDTELFAAIKEVRNGQIYLSPANSKALLATLLMNPGKAQDNDPYKILSPREREVLRLLVRGYSLKEVSDALSLSIKTVDTYKTRIMEKLNFSKKSELIDYAIRFRLLSHE